MIDAFIRRTSGHRRYRTALVAACATATAVAWAWPAAAQEPLPENNAGTGQYVEPVPDAGGDRPARPGADRPRPLPPEVRSELPPGEEGRILERVGTDPGTGAPGGGDGDDDGSKGGGEDGSGDRAPGSAQGKPPTPASVRVDADSSSAKLPVAAVGLLTLLVAGAGLLIRRRRHSG